MAFNKQIEIKNVTANYWRIVGFNLSVTGKMCQIFLCGYESEATREINKNILSLNFIIKEDLFDRYISTENGVFVADLYKYLFENVKEFKSASMI